MGTEEGCFFNNADDAQFVGWIEIDADLDVVARRVGDAAMQRQRSARGATRFVHDDILTRWAVGRQSAATQQLIEASQPAETSAVVEMNVPRMDRPEHW